MNKSRMILGDANDVLRTVPDESIDMILTDIPYGIDYKSNRQGVVARSGTTEKTGKKFFKKIANDKSVPTEWLSDAYRALKNGAAAYIFCHWSKWHILFPAIEHAGFTPKNMIVMNKSNHGMGDLKGQYAPKHELLLFATKGRHQLVFPEKRLTDIWNVPVRYSGAHRLHPNEKPLAWLQPCIEHSTKAGDVVLDPFAGSGSTGDAAKKMGRACVLIEVDKIHFETMKQRLLKK